MDDEVDAALNEDDEDEDSQYKTWDFLDDVIEESMQHKAHKRSPSSKSGSKSPLSDIRVAKNLNYRRRHPKMIQIMMKTTITSSLWMIGKTPFKKLGRMRGKAIKINFYKININSID